jgi:hypothetical protein
MDIDIKPEFDKFTNNPYPKLHGMLNTTRIEREEDSYINTSKSTHPFSKYTNPLSRANIKPNEDGLILRTD